MPLKVGVQQNNNLKTASFGLFILSLHIRSVLSWNYNKTLHIISFLSHKSGVF